MVCGVIIIMTKKVVNFERSLDNVKRKRKGSENSPRYKKGDLSVMQYCSENPLSLPQGVEVHKIFYPKGEQQPLEMARLFSDGLPRKGMSSLKSILYGHVLGPTGKGDRYENFTHLSDENIMSLKDEIIDLVDDPFWRKIEQNQKFGSYAWHGYKSMIDNINLQYSTHGKRDVPDWLRVGIQRAIDELPDAIEALSLEESIAYCKTDTNSGFPCFTSKPFIELSESGTSYTVLNEEMYDIYTHIARQVWEGKAHHNLPAVLFKRIQPGEGEMSKVRIVECVSRGVLWAEARFWRPVLEAMRSIPAYSGYMHYSEGMSAIIEEALEKDHVSSLDYSAYDALSGQYLPVLFQCLATKYPEYAPLLEWCAVYYRECPLLTPHGWIQGEHGLFSGMFGTSFAGSLLNRGFILGMEYAINEKGMCGDKTIVDPLHLAFGDDTVYAWNGTADINDVLGVLTSAGLVLNAGKQEYCRKGDPDIFVMFQACYWRRNVGRADHCVPVYPLVRCAARIAFVEYFDVNTKMIYSAGRKVNDIDCPEVVGPIITAFIAKLMEAEHHPFIEQFCTVYQGVWLHNMNPLLCISEDRILRYIKSELGFIDNTNVDDFIESPLCKTLINGLKLISDGHQRETITKSGLIRDAAARKQRKCGVTHVNNDENDFMEALEDALKGSHSTGLLESVLLHIPMEAL